MFKMKDNETELSEKDLPGYKECGHDFLSEWDGEYPEPGTKYYRL